MVAPRIQNSDGNPISQEMISELIEGVQEKTGASEQYMDGFRFGMERVLLDRARSRLQSSLSISLGFPQD